MAAYISRSLLVCVCRTVRKHTLLPDSATHTHTHQQGPTNICIHITELITHRLTILTSVILASTNNALPEDGVPAPKQVGAILM